VVPDDVLDVPLVAPPETSRLVVPAGDVLSAVGDLDEPPCVEPVGARAVAGVVAEPGRYALQPALGPVQQRGHPRLDVVGRRGERRIEIEMEADGATTRGPERCELAQLSPGDRRCHAVPIAAAGRL